MDDQTLDSLLRALEASPQNVELRFILVKARLERDESDAAMELVADVDAGSLNAEQTRWLAKTYFAAGEMEQVLGIVADDSAGLLLRARALLALERHAEGMVAYQAAVAQNPALEDSDLRDRLAVNVRTFRRPEEPGDSDRPRLKVYSNDDTDDSELQRLLNPTQTAVSFADVGGLEAVKKQIRKKIILPFQKPSLFRRFKKRVGGGILLYGPPGCGKTLLARATAGECDARFFNVAISDVLDMYIGESESKLHALFEKARASTPSVLFFDEIEALGGKRQYTREAASSKLVSQFLSEMDGFTRDNTGVLTLGATNVPWAVDPAFRRPGRFDRLMFVPPPDRPARAAVLEILLRDRPQAKQLDLAYLVQRTSGFSGADLENLVETATDEAIESSLESGEEVPIGDEHLKTALGDVRPTTLEWLTTARNYARYANEAGQYDEVLDFLQRHGR